MKANELMLGNIIQYEYEGERFAARVKEIYNDSVLVEEVSGLYEEIEIPMRDIYPNTINPVFWGKNGFHMKAPDKIYIPTLLAADVVSCKTDGGIEYINKDALLEWAKNLKERWPDLQPNRFSN